MNRFFFIVIAFALFSGAAFAVPSPRDAIELARKAATPAESVKILESSLSGAASLRPWVLLELARYQGSLGNWESSLARSRELAGAGGIPEDIADSAAWWLGEALFRTGKTDEAVAAYLKRIETGSVRDPSLYLAYFRIASSKSEPVLIRFDKAFPVLKNTDPKTFALSRYLCGLCAVREGSWQLALDALSAIPPSFAESFPEYAPWAQYYRAFCLYRFGRWTESIQAFSAYLDSWKGHERGWQAATNAALAALQSRADALPFAERAVSLAANADDRASSIILESSILMERKKYDDAEKLLSGVADGSSTGGLTSQSPRALFSLGEIAAREKDNARAEELWLSLKDRFPKDPLAEEAMYRSGEQWFVAGDWKRAASLFARYRQSWPKGRFLDSVLRSGGDAYFRDGNTDLAILWWEELLSKYLASSAAPRTWADLVAAYKKKAEYAAAALKAREYEKRFPAEAKLDDMQREIAELDVLVKGGDASVAAFETAWKNSGGSKTAEGRSAGVRLARKYLENYGKRAEAKSVLLEITAKSPQNPAGLGADERAVFGAAWALLGSFYREAGDFRQASKALLASGAMYASVDGDRAAEALFGATDSFLQSDLRADAEKTAATLTSTWPDSAWTKRAVRLLEQ
jgi:TolA-binding protein